MCSGQDESQAEVYVQRVLEAAKQQKAYIGQRLHALSSAVPLSAYLSAKHHELESIDDLFLE